MLHLNQYQSYLIAVPKTERRYTEGIPKAERRMSISLLNIKRFTPNLSLCIIRNENEKISKFGNEKIWK